MTTLLPRPVEADADADDAFVETVRDSRRPDGWLVIAMAIVQAVSLGVAFQAHNLLWGGVLLGVALGWLVVALGVICLAVVRARGVHAPTDRRGLLAGSGWVAVVAAVGGWAWMLHPHATAAPWTMLAAALAVVPLAVVGLRLRRAR